MSKKPPDDTKARIPYVMPPVLKSIELIPANQPKSAGVMISQTFNAPQGANWLTIRCDKSQITDPQTSIVVALESSRDGVQPFRHRWGIGDRGGLLENAMIIDGIPVIQTTQALEAGDDTAVFRVRITISGQSLVVTHGTADFWKSAGGTING